MRRRPALLAGMLASALLPLATGCSDDVVAEEPPAADRLEDARAALDAAGSVTLDLSSRDVPQRENVATAAQGTGVVDEAEPKFEGTITGTIEGVAGTVEVIAVGDTTWIKFFTPDYEEADLATLGADEIAYVQFSDVPREGSVPGQFTDRLPPGQGVVPFREFFAAVATTGYRGDLSYEAPNPAAWARDPETVAREALAATRACLT